MSPPISVLTGWKTNVDLIQLQGAVESVGKIVGQRMQRAGSLAARALGYVKDEILSSDDLDNPSTKSDHALVDRNVSGCPANLYEAVGEMLRAGFSPLNSPYLKNKLRFVLDQAVKSFLESSDGNWHHHH